MLGDFKCISSSPLWKPAKNHLETLFLKAKTRVEIDYKNMINSAINETSCDRNMAYIDLVRKISETGIIV